MSLRSISRCVWYADLQINCSSSSLGDGHHHYALQVCQTLSSYHETLYANQAEEVDIM